MAIIVLDPGHGGTTTVGGSSPNNATGPNGLKEKTATLSVALAAERALSSSGADVILTRRTDQNLGIVDRASVAKDNRADVFVSIHFNAPGGSAPAQGTETWIGTGHTAKSLELAKIVQDQVVAATGYRDRGVKVGNVSGVIKPANHRSKTANCLVEISFLSLQAEEEARLRDPAYIEELGTAIAAAATTYLGIGGPMTLASAASALSEPEDGASARRMGFIPPDDEDESLDMEVLDLAGDAEIERVAGARWQDLDAFERMTESAPEAGKTVPLGAMAAPQINFGPNAKEADVTIHARGVLRDVMTRAGLATVTVSSTARSPADQARVMYNNLVTYGVAHQKALYADPGDRVIDVYAAGKAGGKSAARIKAEMEAKIIAIGPTRVSRHASDPAVLCVFDVAPSSVANRAAFEREIRNEGRISKHIFPPGDPGYHFEIPPGA